MVMPAAVLFVELDACCWWIISSPSRVGTRIQGMTIRLTGESSALVTLAESFFSPGEDMSLSYQYVVPSGNTVSSKVVQRK